MLTSSRTIRQISHSSVLAEPQRLIAFPNVPPERSVERLTLRHTWRPWTSFRLGWAFSSLRVCLRCKSRIAARIAGPLVILCALPGFASAQDATWSATPSSPDFNTATNWTPATVPTGTATFDSSTQKDITFSAPATVETLQFNAPGYVFEVPYPLSSPLTITGSGVAGNAPTFNVPGGFIFFMNGSTAGPAIFTTPFINDGEVSRVEFHNTSTAGQANITNGTPSSPTNFVQGYVSFLDQSKAGTATITNWWGSYTEFYNSSSADHATIIGQDGAHILFNDSSTAGNATITLMPQPSAGELSFFVTATAGNAIITNSGPVNFHQESTAGSATITTTTPSGVTNFHDTSNAGTATFTVTGEGVMNFFDQSSAGAASIHVDGTSSVNFNAGSTAGTAKIIAGDMGSTDDFTGGFIFFEGNSTADHAMITAFGDSNIEFDDASHAGNATLIAGLPTRPIGADTNGFIFFTGTSSAENATITVNQFAELSFAPGFFGGGTATAGNANITNNGNTNFYQGSSAGNATITTNAGGVTSFFGRSSGGNAAFIANAGGVVDFSGLGTFPETGDRPPEHNRYDSWLDRGAGTYFLGSKQLTVGSNNLSTTVSGIIQDGGLALAAYRRLAGQGWHGDTDH